ncbi:MAG: hypothetical protein J6I50_01335 [Clostridia bacterium]|nr:hypothetical protein [Clostridia bacterium]
MFICRRCRKEIIHTAFPCQYCGCRVFFVKFIKEDQICDAFCLLSCLLPLFGILYYGWMRQKNPHTARVYGILSLFTCLFLLMIAIFYAAALSQMLAAQRL